MKAKILSLSVIAALGFAVAAQAAVPETGYVGVRGGWAHANIDSKTYDNVTVDGDDKDAVGYGIYAGYNLTSWAAIEAGYNFFDGFSGKVSHGVDSVSIDADIHGPEAALRLAYPLGPDGSDIYIRGGAFWATTDADHGISNHEIAPFVGAGVQYAVTKNFGVRVGYDYYFDVIDDEYFPDTDIGLLYAGLQFTFGGSEPAPAPAPAPQTVTENFTLDAATLFPFDGSSLCEEGVKAVNDVVDSVNAKNIQNAAYDVKVSRAIPIASVLRLTTRPCQRSALRPLLTSSRLQVLLLNSSPLPAWAKLTLFQPAVKAYAATSSLTA